MKSERACRLLLRAYPPAWRARYGDELVSLMLESGERGRVAWRACRDVLLAGARERLRAAGLSGDSVPPAARARAGSLLVLCAWSLFVVAGMMVQRVSEHWRGTAPAAGRTLPAIAFDGLVAAAAIAAVLVLAGAACALPALVAFLRAGRFGEIRAHWARAARLSAAGAAATAGLVAWAQRLSAAQRDGHDTAYALGFSAWGLLLVVCLAAWTYAAVATARRIEWPARALVALARLAAGVAAAMGAITVATALWWAALPASSPSAGASAPLLAALAIMVAATALGLAGARRALAAPRPLRL